jgi:hypothetical protein
MLMRKSIATIFLLFPLIACFAQKQHRREIAIPDISGYLTLKSDLHMHTVFSDGEVWPTTRVQEAWLDGLDVIAITDHLELTPHKQVAKDRNAAHDIAKSKANELNILLIKGSEITRWHPLGHINCLFTTDNESVFQKDSIASVREAKRQGAVIQWNHPGSYRKNNIPEWTPTQEMLYKSHHLDAIEIVNRNEYFPLAHQWAIEKKLAITGGSDIHRPVYMDYGESLHRPMTLVFAKERSTESVKEAILDRRTAVYYGDTLIGSAEFLEPIFKNALKIKNPVIHIAGKMGIGLQLENTSDIPLILKLISGNDDYANTGADIYIPARSTSSLTVKGLKDDFCGERNYTIRCEVTNFRTSPLDRLLTEINFKIVFSTK